MDYEYSGNKIRDLRKRQGYTIERLAEKVDISSKFLYEIEKGRTGFSVNILYELSKVLNISCDYILTENVQDVSDFMIELIKRLNDKERAAIENIILEIIRLREMAE